MKLVRMEVAPGDEARAWEHFANASPMQSVLHNELMAQIFTLRDKLESATTGEILALQADIRALKTLFGLIHRHDKLPTK